MKNNTGWIIAAVLVLALCSIVVKSLFFPSPSPPSEALNEPGFFEVIEPDTRIESVIKKLPTEPGNAADDYQKAIKLLAGEKPENIQTIHKLLSAGAKKETFDFLPIYTDGKIPMGFIIEQADGFVELAEKMTELAKQFQSKDDTAQAANIHKDLLTMGWQMVNSRQHVWLVIKGFEIQRAAAMNLSGALLDGESPELHSEKIDAAKKHSDEVDEALAKYTEKLYKVVWKLDGGYFHPGNIFAVVENDKDRSWRLQGILGLGMLRFNARESADVRYARKLINKYLNDSDPLIAAAAKTANELTEIDYRMIGN